MSNTNNSKLDELLKFINLNGTDIKDKLKEIMPSINENELSKLLDIIQYFGDFKDGKFMFINPSFETNIEINNIEKASLNVLLSVLNMSSVIINNNNNEEQKITLNNHRNIKDIIKYIIKTNNNNNEEQNKKLILEILKAIQNDIAKDISYNNSNTVNLYSSAYYLFSFMYYTFLSSSPNEIANKLKEASTLINDNKEIPISMIQTAPIITLYLICQRYKQKALTSGNIIHMSIQELSDYLNKMVSSLKNNNNNEN